MGHISGEAAHAFEFLPCQVGESVERKVVGAVGLGVVRSDISHPVLENAKTR